MSTSYYLLKKPIKSLRIAGISEDRTEVMISLELASPRPIESKSFDAGILRIPYEEVASFILCFANISDEWEAPVETSWGGAATGLLVIERYAGQVYPDTQLISEDGDLTTLREVRALKGTGKK